ncbi:MAG: RNB domain-containing ribonuclease [Lentisphaerae bacterium]|nr:RNB domain-containing ribonuclease [Lentisphaerota bacterium]
MLIKNNTLVIYKGKGAVVTEVNSDKYLIRTAAGDSKSVRLKDITFLHAGPCQSVPQPAPMIEFAIQEENAELLGDDSISFSDFTELLWNSNTPAAALAAFALLEENCCFSGSVADGVTANSAEHIRSIRNKELQKAAQAEARTALLERIRSGAVTTADHPALREIENVARGETASSKLMHELGMDALPEKAQNLLLKLGVWNEFDHNPWPCRYEIQLTRQYPDFPAGLPEEERLDLTHLTAYAIDDEESNDPDDAISYDAENDILWVHIADVASVIEWDSELEHFACEGGSTLYLPEKILHMLPENAVNIFGLGLQEISPALSFGIKIDSEGNVKLEKIAPSRIKAQRMNYQQGDELMNSDEFKPCVEALQRFRNMRCNNNAVMIRLPEVKVKVDIAGRKIKITPLEQNPVRELVANAMLAAGHAAAEFAEANGFPLPFAVQEDPEMTERPDSMPGMYALRKSCRQSTISTLPGKHAGLGLMPYARVTSPLRRYEDLLAHIQLRKFIANQPLLTISAMDSRLARSEAAAQLNSKLERQCREYWTLVMLKNQPEPWQGEAIYIAKPDERSVWLLPELAFEFKNRYNARIPLGESVQVECIASDPALLTTQFKIIKTNAAADPAGEII